MGGTTVSNPPPIDYSNALMQMSDNNRQVSMAQVGAQIIGLYQASADRQAQLGVQLELGLERLDTKLQISKLNYLQFMTEEENRHVEKIASIDLDAALELENARSGESTGDTSNFLNEDEGGYTPGNYWDRSRNN